jgi:hypothetical protein
MGDSAGYAGPISETMQVWLRQISLLGENILIFTSYLIISGIKLHPLWSLPHIFNA